MFSQCIVYATVTGSCFYWTPYIAKDIVAPKMKHLKLSDMKDKIVTLKTTARIAGLLYFLLAVAAIYGYFYVSPKIMVSGDIAATGNKMLANELLFRTSIFTDLFANILFVVVVLLLYRLFRQINEFQAKLMVGLVMAAIPIALFGGALKITALNIFKGEVFNAFSPQQMQQLASTFLKVGNYSGQMITIFWGLWLLPLGLLVYRSVFIPRILGILLMINGAGYIISSSVFILFPDYVATVSKFVFPTYFIGEIPLIFWLLIVGVRDHLSITIVGVTEPEPKPKKFAKQLD
jgi:hypothetical protein